MKKFRTSTVIGLFFILIGIFLVLLSISVWMKYPKFPCFIFDPVCCISNAHLPDSPSTFCVAPIEGLLAIVFGIGLLVYSYFSKGGR